MKFAPLECAICGKHSNAVMHGNDRTEWRLGPGELVGAHATCVVELLRQVRRERVTGQREIFAVIHNHPAECGGPR